MAIKLTAKFARAPQVTSNILPVGFRFRRKRGFTSNPVYNRAMNSLEKKFMDAYDGLNNSQKLAVDTIEGPLLVVAGPGTGKTQLLTLRIANILRQTDVLPENILCLTFTDSAAHTMRERLTGIIGQAAYNVTISTYHAFGSELLRRYPEYFTATADLVAADDLTIDTTFRTILAKLPYSNPLKHEVFLRDVKTLIRDSTRALLTPADLRTIAHGNQTFIDQTSALTRDVLKGMKRVDKTAGPLFSKLATASAQLKPASLLPASVVAMNLLWHQELEAALKLFDQTAKTTSLTQWKNKWLEKDPAGEFIVAGTDANHKILAAATIYEQYLSELERLGLFDYDDMILRAIRGLQDHTELRYTLQERYLYLLLDEFQDTNEAQSRLVELLTDSPVHEGRPNVLAVGDDDQAIYAFQGANYSHMLSFYKRYRAVAVVPLTQNYRSHADILQLSGAIADQIETRLHYNFPEIDKTIVAASTKLPAQAVVERREFKSELAQYSWVAEHIDELIKQGVPANQIAVLAPKHQYLQSLVPFLHELVIPIHYERRENILEDRVIQELVGMSRLVLALKDANQVAADHAWPQVLGLGFWQLPTSLVWQISWQTTAAKRAWTNSLLEQPDTRPIALFFIRLSQLADSQSLEQMLDMLLGTVAVELHEPDMLAAFVSPFFENYFSNNAIARDTTSFWQLLANLTVLREHLREYRSAEMTALKLDDFLAFVTAHQTADIKILNTNPHQEANQAVELMTVFKAKGQEFAAVFVLAAIDEVWGSKARALGSRLSLPANLQYIRYAGTTEDERLRLLYVALTRAQSQLYLTSYTSTFTGRLTTRLKYLAEQANDDGSVLSPFLPPQSNAVIVEDRVTPELTQLNNFWQTQHDLVTQPELRALLATRLQNYQLSPTQLNSFIDAANDGPAKFFRQALLRFPSAPSLSSSYGNAVHETLEWIHHFQKSRATLPTIDQTMQAYERRLLLQRVGEPHHSLLVDRGRTALEIYLDQRGQTIQSDNKVEYSFRHEGVRIGAAHLNGKIDKLIIDQAHKTIVIVDYKTGKSHARWSHEAKLHFYRNQLYFYKLLVEGSQSFRGYRVIDAYLEFVEPDALGDIIELHANFNDDDEQHLKSLISVVWKHIVALDFPDTSQYSADLKGIAAFENDLLAEEQVE
jgi:DNA helicase II / ATP-dependent DNA helicase PcrA